MAQSGTAFTTPVAFRDDGSIDCQLFMAAVEKCQGFITPVLFTSSTGQAGLSVKPVHLKDCPPQLMGLYLGGKVYLQSCEKTLTKTEP